jgi:RimJ/RimL family protein N-acetyltransferase
VLTREQVAARVRERAERSLVGAREPGLGLALEERDSGRLLGDVMLRVKPARTIAGPVDAWEAMVGYGLHPDVHGQGYAAEAVTALLSIGFRDLGLRRIRADAMAENVPSNRVLEKVGMRLEATEREASLGKDGRWLDVNWWAILRAEWRDDEG